ncbi:MAG: restriction endonuclease subunit S [Synergistaceae bacterium]|nr:restriction endonuclease subunit S [Synergistaceae bacterium]
MNWQTVPLRQLITPNNKRNRPDLPLLSVVRDKGIIKRKLDKSDNHNIIPEDLSNYKVVSEGQFVINKMKAWQGSCGVSQYEGIVSPAYYVFDLNIGNPRFFNYAIRSRIFVDEFGRISSGIRVDQWDLSLQKLKYVLFLLPPREEQDQIVRYLDWKVSQINKLINAKRRQIELLVEQKRVLISTTVNKNLNNWETKRIKYLFSLRDERNYLPASDVRLLSLYAALGVFPTDEIEKTTGNKSTTVENYKKVYTGDIVVNIILCWQGAIGLSIYDGVTSPAYDVYTPLTSEICVNFYHYLFRTKWFGDECYKVGRGIMSMRWRVYSDKFTSIRVPVPLITEQRSIVVYLDEQCGHIDKVISKLNDEIALTTEYRARLISDVVTGKLDVRGVSVPEYDVVEQVMADLDGEIDFMENEG